MPPKLTLRSRPVVNPHEATRPSSPPPAWNRRDDDREPSSSPSGRSVGESERPDRQDGQDDSGTGTDRTAERIRDQQQQGGTSSTTEDGTIVAISTSRTGQQYTTVRDAESGESVVYRSEGSVVHVMDSDGRAADPGRSRGRRLIQRVADRGHLVSHQRLSDAFTQALPKAPGTGDINRFNVLGALERDQDYIRQQLSALSDRPGDRALQLDELAGFARGVSERYGMADLDGFDFVNPETGEAALAPPDFFAGQADEFSASAQRNRQAEQDFRDRITANERARDEFTRAETDALSPLQYDPLEEGEIDERRPLAGFARQEADLGSTAAAYARLADEWRGRPENQLLQIDVSWETPGPTGRTETPADYFQRQADNYSRQAGQVPAVRDAALTEARRLAARSTARQFEDAVNPDGVFLPGETGGDIQFTESGLAVSSQGLQQLVESRRQRQEPLPMPGESGGLGSTLEIDPDLGLAASPSAVGYYRRPQVVATPDIPDESAVGPLPQQFQYFRATDTPGPDGQVLVPITQQQYQTALNARADQQRQVREDLGLIRGDLSQELTGSDLLRLVEDIQSDRQTAGPQDLTPITDARLDRYQRFIRGDYATLESVKAANPGLSDEDARNRVLLEAMLDLVSDDYSGISRVADGQQLEGELRRRGFGVNEAEEYKQLAVDRGWSSNVDFVIAGGGAVGSRIAGPLGDRIARRLPLPRFLQRTNPRFTRGSAAGFIEETGEEIGEPLAEILFTGDPSQLFSPVTYGAAGASILGSGFVEADRIRPLSRSGPITVSAPSTSEQYQTQYERLLVRGVNPRTAQGIVRATEYRDELVGMGIDSATANRLARRSHPIAGGIHPASLDGGSLVPGRPDTPFGRRDFTSRYLSTNLAIIPARGGSDALSLDQIRFVPVGGHSLRGSTRLLGGDRNTSHGRLDGIAPTMGRSPHASRRTYQPNQMGVAIPTTTAQETPSSLTQSQSSRQTSYQRTLTAQPASFPGSQPAASVPVIAFPTAAFQTSPELTPTPPQLSLQGQPSPQPFPTSPMVTPAPTPTSVTPNPAAAATTAPTAQVDTPTNATITPVTTSQTPGGTSTTITTPQSSRRRLSGRKQRQRRIRTGEVGTYPDAYTWETRNRKTFDPETGIVTSSPVDFTNLESLRAVGRSSAPPRASNVEVGNLRLRSDARGVTAEAIPLRSQLVSSGPRSGTTSKSRRGAGRKRGGRRFPFKGQRRRSPFTAQRRGISRRRGRQ